MPSKKKTEIDDWICVEDFTGSYRAGLSTIPYFTYGADYSPSRRIVTYCGRWMNVPDMPSDTEPTEEQVHTWAEAHGGFFFTPDERSRLDSLDRLSLQV